MRATKLRSSCPDGNTCPAIWASDRGTLVIQGYVCESAVDTRMSGHVSVELPLSLLPELASRRPCRDIYLNDRGGVIMSGPELVDPELLEQLALPEGEAAIEVAASVLPELRTAGI